MYGTCKSVTQWTTKLANRLIANVSWFEEKNIQLVTKNLALFPPVNFGVTAPAVEIKGQSEIVSPSISQDLQNLDEKICQLQKDLATMNRVARFFLRKEVYFDVGAGAA